MVMLTLHRRLNCIVANNGYSSKPRKLTTGTRQGCPLSPLLYILVAETLANLVCQNPGIDGLFLPGSNDQVKISQYADDAILLLLREYSVHKAFEMIEIYEKGSGSKLNMNRTKGNVDSLQSGTNHRNCRYSIDQRQTKTAWNHFWL